jgi:hypothetical protein
MPNNPAVQFRPKPDLRKRLEDWRRVQDNIPAIADTVRHFVERGLDAEASDTDWPQGST